MLEVVWFEYSENTDHFNLRLMRPLLSKRYIEDAHIISLHEYHYFDKNATRWYVLVG